MPTFLKANDQLQSYLCIVIHGKPQLHDLRAQNKDNVGFLVIWLVDKSETPKNEQRTRADEYSPSYEELKKGCAAERTNKHVQ